MVIAKVDLKSDAPYWGYAVKECVAVIELKYKGNLAASKDIYEDYDKLKLYIEELGVKCKLYMGTIWECDDSQTTWARKNAAWAKGKVTELNASISQSTGEPQFYIAEH